MHGKRAFNLLGSKKLWEGAEFDAMSVPVPGALGPFRFKDEDDSFYKFSLEKLALLPLYLRSQNDKTSNI